MNQKRSAMMFTISLLLLLLSSNAASLAAESGDKPLLSPLPCTLTLDGKTQNVPIYVNQKGESMVSIANAFPLFSCNFRFQTDGTVLANHMYITQSFPPQEYISALPFESLTPYERLDDIYLPLRRLAQGFSYAAIYQSQGPIISLQSPAYQEQVKYEPILPADPEIIPNPPDNLPQWGVMGPELRSRWPNSTFISSFYTTLINSSEARTNNIILSSGKINGTILESGELFSFNKTVGRRTSESGYKQAAIFVGNKVDNEIGGGICQTASTLYNTALESGMQIVERHPHTLPVTYCPPQRDATVYWGSADLKIKNTLGRPIQILSCVYERYVLTAFVEVE